MANTNDDSFVGAVIPIVVILIETPFQGYVPAFYAFQLGLEGSVFLGEFLILRSGVIEDSGLGEILKNPEKSDTNLFDTNDKTHCKYVSRFHIYQNREYRKFLLHCMAGKECLLW